ncbi:putative inorganic phosphate cotransporter [Lycorma delicatula]|uniref:putative inorganic phosphate cotransporter n=1 Tax=Lycorma delicatula TaxID=130591 RepID=UPI003F5166BE
MSTVIKEMSQQPAPVIPPGGRFGTRHGQALLTFFSVVSAYAMRVNLSVGIVAMTDKSSNPDFPELNWDSSTKGIILGSFFWGYLVTQIPAGQFAGRFGPKYLLGGAVLYCGLLTLLTPLAALKGDWLAVFVLRVLQGLGQGCIYPCVNTHLSKWAPPPERSRLFAFVFSGTQLGTVITLYVAGQLAGGPGGWPSIFYVTGIFSVIWALLWLYVGADSPSEHKSISEEEKNYIQTSLIHSSANSKSMKVPWKKIVTSVPMWALLLTHLAQNWGFWTLLTLMPSYINAVLGFDIKSNGTLSALPYLGNFILTLCFSWVADKINQKEILMLSTARKMWNSIGLWGGAAALVLLATVARSVESAVTLLTLAVALNSGTFMGYLTNHLDLAPNFAGVLMGITNGISNITSILGPMVAGFIVTNEKDESEWRIVFLISATVFFLGNSIFVLFGSTDVQTWNNPESKEQKREGATA